MASSYIRVNKWPNLSLGTKFAPSNCVTVVEAIVVYLSIGAPFGVLQFFTEEVKSPMRIATRSVLAILFWPYFAISSSLARRKEWQSEKSSVPDMTALFRIAGHSNPQLARICYERGRRKMAEKKARDVESGPATWNAPSRTIDQVAVDVTFQP